MSAFKQFAAILLSFLSLVLPDVSRGQTLPFRSYSIERGLSESVAYDLLQDSDGFLWIATGYGLNRFDGVEMATFYERDGLNDNQINVLHEDNTGRLWIGSDSGVNVMEAGVISSLPELVDLERYTVLSILHDDQGDYWFGTENAGVWLLDETRQLTQFSTVHGLGGNRVSQVVQDGSGVLWFATDRGLTHLDSGNFNTFTTDHGLPDNRINDILLAGEGSIWLATEGGISHRQGASYTNWTVSDGVVFPSVLALSLGDSGQIWYGSDSGAGWYNGDEFISYTTEDGLPSNIVYSLLTDREGNIWLGTLGGGATIFPGDHFHNYSVDQGLSSNVITSFAEEADGSLWIASYGGGLMTYTDDGFETLTVQDGLVDNKVNTLYGDSSGRIWAGTTDGASLLEDRHIISLPDWLPSLGAVRGFFEDRSNGDFWVATQDSGAYRYDGSEVTHYHEENVLASNSVMSISQDGDGRIWLATYGGATLFDDGEFRTYTTEDGLPGNGIIDVYVDREGVPWISTYNGFARFGDQGIETFESSVGFPGAISYFMFQDSDGYHWTGTNVGLIRFDYERYRQADSALERDLSFRLVSRDQGLIANEMNARAVLQSGSGSVWLGSVEGLSRFYPSRLPNYSTPPIVHLEEVIAAGRSVSADSNPALSHDQGLVQFTFTGVSFEAPERILYEYRLRGVDSDWVRSYNRLIRYPSLAPGDYEFEVRAYNSSGIRSVEPASFEFTILNPFWLQWWFLILLIFVLAGAVLFIYNYTRVRKQMEIEKMRVQIASDLHDDVGSSLTELALQTDFLRTGELEESVELTLRQIGDHSRRIVSALDDIVWYIDARNDTTGDLTDRMQDHAARLLEGRGCQFGFDFSGVEMNEKLSVLVKENLYLIYKEAINNIAKHSNANQVDVSLSMNQNRFMLRITDNGSEKDESRKSGQGLRNMELRARRIGAEVSINRNGGFQVVVKGTGALKGHLKPNG